MKKSYNFQVGDLLVAKPDMSLGYIVKSMITITKVSQKELPMERIDYTDFSPRYYTYENSIQYVIDLINHHVWKHYPVIIKKKNK